MSFGIAIVGLHMFLAWLLVDWRWAIVPLLVFITYAILFVREDQQEWENNPVLPYLIMGVPGAAFVILEYLIPDIGLYYSYSLTWVVALVGIGLVRTVRPVISKLLIDSVMISLRGWLVIFIPFVLLQEMSPAAMFQACSASVMVYLASVMIGLAEMRSANLARGMVRWWVIAIVSAGLGASGLFVKAQVDAYLMIS